VAFTKDLALQYKYSASDDYKELEDILFSPDRTFLSCLVAITTATEFDMVAKSVMFLGHNRQIAADLVEYFAAKEILATQEENTLFRIDNMASKMFKFYSKIVGVNYLFQSLARVINELELVVSEKEHDVEKGKASILDINMEVDPTRFQDDVDKDANLFQLSFTCQKIIQVIIANENKIPQEFRRLFTRMKFAILSRFNSNEAVYKALGGFLFLRFICPAITAPGVYGILEQNPSPKLQRQLVLVAKVIQNVANMSKVTKESFMDELAVFRDKNIPKIKGFYDQILDVQKMERAQPNSKVITVPEEVRLNALCNLHAQIANNCNKLQQSFNGLDPEQQEKMNQALQRVNEKYGKAPKKINGEDPSQPKSARGDKERLLDSNAN
jgi:neurofibromin 1